MGLVDQEKPILAAIPPVCRFQELAFNTRLTLVAC
jgi:hypothetical protein